MSNDPVSNLPVMYRGSVKDLRGPIELVLDEGGSGEAVIFEYSEAYSVFDWGRMPDALSKKGSALAVIAADWFEKLERPETWKEFSRTTHATALRKNRFGAEFNELGEELQQKGLRTHYLGALSEGSLIPQKLAEIQGPVRNIAVRAVSVVKPAMQPILGRAVPDYLPTRNAPAPRLIPLEVVFRFSCPEGSSLYERVARDPGYLASIGFADYRVAPDQKWDFPVLELFTKLETSDRPLGLGEGLAISGLSGEQMQRLLLSTAWVAGWLRAVCAKAGVELADGKLEWGVDASGEIFLVDAIGPDELRLLKDGVQLSKEFLRMHYRDTSWYQALARAKETARAQGVSEWKRLVGEQPAALPPAQKELASHLYMALANELTGRRWFGEAWGLAKVVDGIRAAPKSRSESRDG